MRISKAEQGTTEWLMDRLGCPSGSGFSKLIKADGNPSASANTYINQLIAEKLMNEVPESYENEWMIRGKELEPEAKSWYEFAANADVQEVGFIKHDEYECGVSPDGLVEAHGGLEIKCPAPSTHIKYLRAQRLPSEYKAQVMGCLWITGRKWWDFLSYHPSLPPFLLRVERDQKFIDSLEQIVIKACKEIEQEVKKIEVLR